MTTSRVLLHTAPTTDDRAYTLLVTTDPAHVRAAQRLRHDVFTAELGAEVGGGPDAVPGHDVDRFDAFCEHLVVCDAAGAVVGTYRVLPPERAAAAGGRYADGEFDLAPLRPLLPQLVEIGRTCVHPDHRSGAVIGLLWAGLARYALLTGNRWLGGCASIPLSDGGGVAAAVWRSVAARHLAPPEQRVRPLEPWDAASAPRALRPAFPPLLRGYLRLGAQVCGPPAHDRRFRCADLFTVLDVERVDRRLLRHLLGDAG